MYIISLRAKIFVCWQWYNIHYFTASKNILKYIGVVSKCLLFEVLHSSKSSIYHEFAFSDNGIMIMSLRVKNFPRSQWYNKPYFTVNEIFDPLKQSEPHLNTQRSCGLWKLQNKDIILLFPSAIRNNILLFHWDRGKISLSVI